MMKGWPMIIDGKTFGDFFDAVNATTIATARSWMNDWKEHVDEAGWKKDRALPLVSRMILHFTEDMINAFRNSMLKKNTPAMHKVILHDGKEFMIWLSTIAKKFGVDVSEIVTSPITHSYPIVQAQNPVRSTQA